MVWSGLKRSDLDTSDHPRQRHRTTTPCCTQVAYTFAKLAFQHSERGLLIIARFVLELLELSRIDKMRTQAFHSDCLV